LTHDTESKNLYQQAPSIQKKIIMNTRKANRKRKTTVTLTMVINSKHDELHQPRQKIPKVAGAKLSKSASK
jgi:hypothetical protein